MIGIYFSGTGNTEYCIKKFVSVYAPGSPIISIEDNSILEAINQHQEIIFAYPIYYSYLPIFFHQSGTKSSSIPTK